MFMVYLVFILACLSTTQGTVKAIKKKSIGDLFMAILPLPFCFCFFIGVLSGGSAFHDAKNDYELYQSGHYYLVSHGKWTEVSYERYMFIFISEIIGFSSLPLYVIFSIIHGGKNKQKIFQLPNNIPK